jgi:uncharacterized protein (DUF1330 family)
MTALKRCKRCANAPEYKALVALRDNAADYHSFIVEGSAN